jgi:class 3 adenylate cyclase/HAMP domain-containing protein
MKIYSKILLATLPLVILAFLAAGGITYYLSRGALREIADDWLATRSLEASQAASEQLEFLQAYGLDTIAASVDQAKSEAGAMMSTIEIGKEGFVFVADGSGRLIHSRNDSLKGVRLDGEAWFPGLKSSPSGELSLRLNGEQHLAHYRYFEPWDWYVFASDPEREIYGAVNRLGWYVLALGVGGSILIALVLMLLTKRVTAPLAQLAEGAEKVGRGELDTTITVSSGDELGLVAQAFNDMTKQLRALYSRLEERLSAVVSKAPIVLFSTNEAGQLTLLEGKGLGVLNLESERLLGQGVTSAFEDSPDIIAAINQAQRGEIVSTFAEFGARIFEVWCAPLVGMDRANRGVIGVATDVTDRIAAEKKLRRQAEYLNALNQTTLGIISRLELDELLEALIKRAGQLLQAPHGFIYLAEEEDDTIRRKVGVGVYEDSVGYRLQPGQGAAGRVWESGEPFVINDYATWDGRVPNPKYDGFVRALAAVPLKSGSSIIGVLGMAYDKGSDRDFGEEEVSLLGRFAELASVSLDNARLYSSAREARLKAESANAAVQEKNKELESLSSKLSKYLSPQVYSSIFSGKQRVELSSKRKKLTIFFSDIAGFTETTDQMESEDLTSLLNHYLTEMSQIALAHGATIDKYVGDAIVIFFGDPETKGVKEDALACVRMAIAMRDRMLELSSLWRASGVENPLRCRIGINTGYSTVGNFGSDTRMDYTIIGGGVNLASRLETAADPGEILISYETYAHVKDEILCEERGKISVKGLAYPIATYAVVGVIDAIAERDRLFREELPKLGIKIDFDRLSDQDAENVRRILEGVLKRLTS